MKKNLCAICAYHDITKLNLGNINKYIGGITQNIQLINNNYCKSDFLKEIIDQYGVYPGVVFDEFNAQSYYCDVVNDDSEYIYNFHYRRCLDLPKNFTLQPKTIICNGTQRGYTIQRLYKDFVIEPSFIKKHPDIMKQIYFIYSEIFNMLYEDVENIFKYSMFMGREMYICHKDVHKDMVHKCYKFIKLVLEKIDLNLFNKKRAMGFMIEGFISFYIITKRNKEGYNIYYTPIKEL